MIGHSFGESFPVIRGYSISAYLSFFCLNDKRTHENTIFILQVQQFVAWTLFDLMAFSCESPKTQPFIIEIHQTTSLTFDEYCVWIEMNLASWAAELKSIWKCNETKHKQKKRRVMKLEYLPVWFISKLFSKLECNDGYWIGDFFLFVFAQNRLQLVSHSVSLVQMLLMHGYW